MNGFDILAPVYDPLARLIYRGSIKKSQTCLLGHIGPGSRVLIMGGGTGWILEELMNSKPDIEVYYVDSSAEMIARTRRRKIAGNIHLITGSCEYISRIKFDTILSCFFLDLFSEDTVREIIQTALRASTPPRLWLVADFVDRGVWWQKSLLFAMYRFFNVLCKIPARQLPNWRMIFEQSGFEKLSEMRFYGGFIEGAVFRPIG